MPLVEKRAGHNGPARRKRPGRKKCKAKVYINLTHCKYDVVYDCAEDLGWKPCFDEDNIEWDVLWIDTSVSVERVMRLQPFQKINHFPGMYQICRKTDLARSLMRMAQYFPEYRFFPRTWILPEQGATLKAQLRRTPTSRRSSAWRVDCQQHVHD